MGYQIIYSSVSSAPMESEDLQSLLVHAQSNNSQNGVTGALVYADRFFLQILEGGRDHVKKLMQRISNDVRHELITVLQEGEISYAAFSAWEMAYVSATPEQVAKWAGLGATTRLPEVLSSMREDPQKAVQVTQSILSVLEGKLAQQPRSK